MHLRALIHYNVHYFLNIPDTVSWQELAYQWENLGVCVLNTLFTYSNVILFPLSFFKRNQHIT